MYKLVLCHRVKDGVASRELHEHWRQVRSGLVRELQLPLGFTTYGQTHQSSRLNPVYLSVLFSRSPLIVSLVGAKKPPRTQPLEADERWDVTDEFEFPSKDALVQAVLSEAGSAAARRLMDDHSPLVRRTSVVTSEEFVSSPDPAPLQIDLRTDFYLRRRPELTREAMLAYWGDTHKRLVLSLQNALGYRGYNQLHVRTTPELSAVINRFGGSPGDEFDGVAELSFTSQAVPFKGIFNPRTEIANAKLINNESEFIDHGRSALVYGNHYRFVEAARPLSTAV